MGRCRAKKCHSHPRTRYAWKSELHQRMIDATNHLAQINGTCSWPDDAGPDNFGAGCAMKAGMTLSS